MTRDICCYVAVMALFVAACRRRRGQVLGAEEGKALIASTDAWAASEEIKNPERMIAIIAPGYWSSP